MFWAFTLWEIGSYTGWFGGEIYVLNSGYCVGNSLNGVKGESRESSERTIFIFSILFGDLVGHWW